MSLLESLIAVISPECCVICNKEGSLICKECLDTHVPRRKPACFWCNSLTDQGKTCERCRRKTSLSGAIVPFRFNETVANSIYRLKYDGNRAIASFFARELKEYIEDIKIDYISYVPSTGASQRRRGYNQARLLAKQLSQCSGIEMKNLLLRTAHIDQIGLNRSQRLTAVDGNFCTTSYSCRDKQILLVDDVITTGSTVNECARILKAGGAKSVWAVAIAKK